MTKLFQSHDVSAEARPSSGWWEGPRAWLPLRQAEPGLRALRLSRPAQPPSDVLPDHQGDGLHRGGRHHRDRQASPGLRRPRPRPAVFSRAPAPQAARSLSPAPSPPRLCTRPPLQLLCPAAAASRAAVRPVILWSGLRHKPPPPCLLLVRRGSLELPP